MIFNKVSIVGMGLIGGSLAKAIKRSHPECFIVAVDSNEDTLKAAKDEKIADKITSDLPAGVKDVDLVFLCLPIHVMNSTLRDILPLLDRETIVTDVGSTKHNIVKAAKEIYESGDSKALFIGGHPMAGTQYSGYQASIPHLFENAYYVLTPLDSTPAWAINSLSEFLSSLGALPLVMEGPEHDRIIGLISHLPHVVAAALVNTVKDMDDPSHHCERLAAGGFRDITRIASSNPEMWKNVSLLNKKELTCLIEHIISHLSAFSSMLSDNEESGIEDFFVSAKTYRENLPTRQALDLLSYYELYVDVEDRPGIVGEVATILGNHSINIKNLRIINSREGHPGSLVISLPDGSSLKEALNMLQENGYRAFVE